MMIAKQPGIAVLLTTMAFSVVLHVSVCRAQSPPARGQGTRSRAEVEALIQQMGTTPPDWWDSVKLDYPPTLDLGWPLKPGGQWDARRNVGQYIWDIINPNPGRWKEGIKLVHYLMIRHKDDRDKLGRSMETLGRMFHDLMQDWARAAFWWRKSMQYDVYVDPISLAHCYWKLGSREMAEEALAMIPDDYTRHGALIKLWTDMGEIDKALELAERKALAGGMQKTSP